MKVKYEINSSNFYKIPGNPIAYWIPLKTFQLFEEKPKIGELFISKTGMTTGDNNRFLRNWYEVDSRLVHKKWMFYNKGGGFRKWYGNIENIIFWENNGELVKNANCSTIRNPNYYFHKCISWNLITTDRISVRALDDIFVMGDAGPACYFNNDADYWFMLGLLNSIVSDYILKIINPTINYSCGVMDVFPVCYGEIVKNAFIKDISYFNTKISKKDWDSFETSWDFSKHPLI